MHNANETRLNVGAGYTYIPGYINVDLSSKADITIDLGTVQLPFEDDSVDLIFSYHTLEHVSDYLFALSEIHRVLKHGALFLVGLPYVTLTKYHLVNPYHRHNFNEYSFDFFDPKKLKGSAAEENSITFRKVFHRVHHLGVFKLVPPPFNSWCRRHLLNVAHKIDFGLLAIKDPEDPVPPVSERSAAQQFDKCLKSRIAYEEASYVHY